MPEIENRLSQPTTATQANSNTVAIALAAQKRWKVAASAFGVLTTLGLAAATAGASVMPLFVGGLIATGIGAVGTLVSAVASGAELDEKALQTVSERVAKLLESKAPKP